jgi:diketogulonate reductase-like aldo/keto reductase
LESLDLYYLQNPYEAVGPYNTDNVFFDKLKTAFETLEKACQEGKIKNYGLATFKCFRVDPNKTKEHLSL